MNQHYFDTITIDAGKHFNAIKEKAAEAGINFRRENDRYIGISIDEKTGTEELRSILNVLSSATNKKASVRAMWGTTFDIHNKKTGNSKTLEVCPNFYWIFFV